jgi:HK97 family phage major capsid protein
MAAEPLGPDLYRFLVDTLYGTPQPERGESRWVMNQEWWNECRKIAGADGRPAWEPPHALMLGKPVEVRVDGGVPHLERGSAPTPVSSHP